MRCVGGAAAARSTRPAPGAGAVEDHYATLRLTPGASRGEVKKAFHRLALEYHPDAVGHGHGRGEGDGGVGVDFERINAAYQRVMSNIRAAEERLEYWRQRYGLADEDLDRYRYYLNDDDDDDEDW